MKIPKYRKDKLNDNYDVIVIGSGIGGLTCAGLLSRVGKRVLVLEQHTIAGGCTHSFEDKGYEFDLILLAASLVVIVSGPGRISISHLIKKIPRVLQ